MSSRRLLALFIVWGLGSWAPACAAAIQGQDATQPHWAQVKTLLARGAYREALEELEIIFKLTPNDPWVSTYRSLCKKRLQTAGGFAQLTPEELAGLRDTLRREQEAQATAAAHAKAHERGISKEQAAWDAQLKRLERETAREQKRQQRHAKAEAIQRRRAAERALRELAKPSKPRPAPVTTPQQPPTTAFPAPTTTTTPPAQPSPVSARPAGLAQPKALTPPPHVVELQPVTVPTAAPEQPPAGGPAPAEQPVRPPGAVQIFADQLSSVPERRLAVAQGNVRVLFEDGQLTCDQATVFTDTKDVYAKGRVRLERGPEVFRGEMIHYNFETKKGRFLEGTAFVAPWYQHGRVVEHITPGVLLVKPGYLTSCELEPPHFRFQGREATVFTSDKLARGRNVTLVVEELPLLYLPRLSVADRQSPFFIIPGKKKPWGPFVLMGYRYEWPPGNRGAIRLDWRRFFLWGMGLDDQFETRNFGKGIVKVYFDNRNFTVSDPKAQLPKGAALKRYRVLVRHNWPILPDTTVVTDFQKFSDANFRKDLLFREEYVADDTPESFISMVTNDPHFTLSLLAKKRVNRFQGGTEAFPEASINVVSQRIGETNLYTSSGASVANLQTRTAHSDADTDVVKATWSQGFSYALNLFRPILVTPRVNIQQAYYTKDKQGGSERPQGKRDVVSGQFSTGADASLKLFRIVPVLTNWLGLNIHQLRHVLTPTVGYSYIHPPTVPNDLLSFAAASAPTNQLSFGIENKLQTKRPDASGNPRSVDLARFLTSLPYTFRGIGNKQGGRVGDWSFKLELYPWPWMRLETNWSYPSHFPKGVRDERVTAWNLDLVMVGGGQQPSQAQQVPGIQAPPPRRAFKVGPHAEGAVALSLPKGQWYLGLGHRYSYNDKTETVAEFDWRLSEKWQIGMFHRYTWKEVAGSSKRFHNLRETQYTLTRDLHDWVAEAVYHVDREYGEELYFTLTLKAYPELPIRLAESYHQPKIGSQSSPFSPVAKR